MRNKYYSDNQHTCTVENRLDFEITFYKSIVEQAPRYTQALLLLGEAYALKGLHGEGIKIDKRLAELTPSDPIVYYNLACGYSLIHRKKEALRCLEQSIKLGYSDLAYLTNDKDFSYVREDPRFKRLVRNLCVKILERLRESQTN